MTPWLLRKSLGCWRSGLGECHIYMLCMCRARLSMMGAHGWAGWGAADQLCWAFTGAGAGHPGRFPGILGCGERGVGVGELEPWGKSFPCSEVSLAGSEAGHGRGWVSSGQALLLCLLNWAGTDAPSGHLHWALHLGAGSALFTGHTGTQC